MLSQDCGENQKLEKINNKKCSKIKTLTGV